MRWLFSWLLHPDLAMRFGHWWSGKSRKSHGAEELDVSLTEPLIEYARRYAAEHDVDHFVFGHMHFPRDYRERGPACDKSGVLGEIPFVRRAGRIGRNDFKNAGEMKQYLDLLRRIKAEGVVRAIVREPARKGVFGHQMRFDLGEGFPLLTTKKVFLKGVIHELLWFLAGDTNIRYLVENGVHIWDNDAYRYYNELCVRHGVLPVDRETFLCGAGGGSRPSRATASAI